MHNLSFSLPSNQSLTSEWQRDIATYRAGWGWWRVEACLKREGRAVHNLISSVPSKRNLACEWERDEGLGGGNGGLPTRVKDRRCTKCNPTRSLPSGQVPAT